MTWAGGWRKAVVAGLILLVGWLSFAQGVGAQALLPIPPASAHVIDQTGTLDASQVAALDAKLAAFQRDKGSQIVIFMVATTQPEDISSFANRVGNTWKIGRKEVGDGLLLIVAKNDRKVRIEVAKSLEGAIPDLAAKQIIDSAITPNFKAGNFTAGLGAASELIMARITAEGLPAGAKAGAGGFQSQSPGLDQLANMDWMGGLIFLLFAVPIGVSIASAYLGRKLGSVVAGGGVGALAFFVTTSVVLAVLAGVAALVWALMVGTGASRAQSPRMRGRRGFDAASGAAAGSAWGGSWGSGSGGFGSGGGFSSGGGGDFGGGGASGDW